MIQWQVYDIKRIGDIYIGMLQLMEKKKKSVPFLYRFFHSCSKVIRVMVRG